MINFRLPVNWAIRSLPALLLILAFGCASVDIPKSSEPRVRLEMAKREYENEKYVTAIELFKQFILDYPGISLTDDAIYFLGSSYLRTKEFTLAAEEFERLVRDFPEGEFTPQARYELGLSYFGQSRPAPYDQEMTVKALEEFEYVRTSYPETAVFKEAEKMILTCRSRLAEKIYLSGVLYLKLGYPQIAREYFERVEEEYFDTRWRASAAFGEGMAFEKEEHWKEAVNAYEKVKAGNPDNELTRKAAERVRVIQRKLEERESKDRRG